MSQQLLDEPEFTKINLEKELKLLYPFCMLVPFIVCGGWYLLKGSILKAAIFIFELDLEKRNNELIYLGLIGMFFLAFVLLVSVLVLKSIIKPLRTKFELKYLYAPIEQNSMHGILKFAEKALLFLFILVSVWVILLFPSMVFGVFLEEFFREEEWKIPDVVFVLNTILSYVLLFYYLKDILIIKSKQEKVEL